MKKVALFLIVILLLASTVLCVQAAGTASVSGPATVRAGDTITVSFSAGGGILGGSGTVSYDSSLLTLQSYSQVIGGSWIVEFSGNSFVFYDNNMNSPINGNTTIFTATFAVNSSLSAGTDLAVSVTGITLSDGTADTVVGSRTYSTQIAPPLSSNCDLASLTVSNATLSPAFSSDTTSYSASVPFTTTALQLQATTADSNAKVSVSNPQLVAGTTTIVRITVTAENGAVKEYTIRVTRAQDPNYVKSSDTQLQSLSVEGFILSPGFSADITRYYVWLPYEQAAVTIHAEAAHTLAGVSMDTCDELLPGKGNDIAITVTAEDGTQQVYTVTVFRAPAHADTDAFLQGERTPEVEPETEPATEPATEPVTEPVTEPTEDETAPEPDDTDAKATGWTGILLACIVCLLAGIGLGILIIVLVQKVRQ